LNFDKRSFPASENTDSLKTFLRYVREWVFFPCYKVCLNLEWKICTKSCLALNVMMLKLQQELCVFAEYNQQDAKFLKFIYFCKTLYMFQTVFPSIIRSSKLHIQLQVFVRPLLLPADSLARLAAGKSIGMTKA